MSEKWITPQGNRSNSDLGYVTLTPKRVDPAAEWRRRAEFAEARVQAVRDAIEAELERHTLTNLGDFMFLDQALGRILNALDGDNDA